MLGKLLREAITSPGEGHLHICDSAFAELVRYHGLSPCCYNGPCWTGSTRSSVRLPTLRWKFSRNFPDRTTASIHRGVTGLMASSPGNALLSETVQTIYHTAC